MYPFDYVRPRSIEEAAEAFAMAEEARYLAGGQSLIPLLKHRLSQASVLIDLGRLPELTGARDEDGVLTLGARITHAEVAASPLVRETIPSIAALAGMIGDRQVRNLGTLGGSLAHNDPAGDWPAAALALGAIIQTDRRRIAADEFFTGMFETALQDGEIVVAVRFPAPERAVYLKFPSPASRYALVGVMVARTPGGIRMAVTGAGPAVFRAAEAEEALAGDFSADRLAGVSFDAAALGGDLHASAQYRSHLIRVLARRAVKSMQ